MYFKAVSAVQLTLIFVLVLNHATGNTFITFYLTRIAVIVL